MQFHFILSILLCITVPSALARIVPASQNDGLQIPIGEEEVETLTFHFTTTRTRFEFEFYTKTMTREHATSTAEPMPTGSVEDQGARMHMSGRTDKCDETACSICTWYYRCKRGTSECFQCDTKSYCEC